MPKIDLSMLNQRQTPAFYADVLANRPAAGFIGRIFVSTNTYAFYRDNGTGWDLIGGPGTGTVTGSGAANQVAFWSGASLITGENNLWWDDVNNYLGVGTNTPGAAIDAHSAVNVIQQLNQTVATNNSLLAFQNAGAGLWRIGNFYNSGANDYGVYDVIGAAQPFTIKKTTGQVLIGTTTVGSGKLVVASATGDNGVQIVGASAPSLRIDNAESGPTKRAGLGISTAANNFIQGSVDRDFCMFNGSTTASPILFGIYGTTNVQEAARISPARNLLVGLSTDAGFRLSVGGTSYFSSNILIGSTNTGADGISLYQNLNYSFAEGLGESYVNIFRQRNSAGAVLAQGYKRSLTSEFASSISISYPKAAIVVGEINGSIAFYSDAATTVPNGTNISPTSKMNLDNTGNLLINYFDTTGNRTNPVNVLTLTANNGNAPYDGFGSSILFKNQSYVTGVVNSARIRSKIYDGGGLEGGGIIFETTPTAGGALTPTITIKYTGVINIANMPTSAAGLVSGDLYRTANVVNIVP